MGSFWRKAGICLQKGIVFLPTERGRSGAGDGKGLVRVNGYEFGCSGCSLPSA